MGVITRKNLNEVLAPKKITKSLNLIGRLLSLIGKPFYFALVTLLVTFVSLLYITGYLTRVVLTNFSKLVLKTSSLLVKKIPYYRKLIDKLLSQKLNLLKRKIALVSHGLKKIPSVQLGKKFTLSLLRLRLFLIKLSLLLPKVRVVKFKLFLLSLGIFLVVLIPPSYLFWSLVIKDLPTPSALTSRNLEASTKIYDRNGVLLYKIFENQNRTPVKLAKIPIQVRLATLAIEDAEFYSHPGFSIRGIFRAVVKVIRSGEITGGSTITQQLVKNTLLSPEKTLVRKLKEVVLAIQVERVFSKDEILEMYLNEVSYGGTAYGIQEAARVYFDKDVDQLTLSEAALLAGLPKSPTQYSPFGPHPILAYERQKEVLNLMKINHYINENQEGEALAEKITFAPNRIDIKAPHFVMYVRSLLEEKYGKEMVEKGGLDVTTTLDYQIQKLAEKVVKEEVAKLLPLNVRNAAVLVLNPKTGEVLAMVGSKDYFDTAQDGNVNVTTSLRPPGSSIKLVNYAYAFFHGFTPASVVSDSPVTFVVPGQPPYTPRNYDGNFRGNITLRSALAESRNVVAVKVLASYGVEKMIEEGQKMGISTWTNPANYGLSLTLGGGDVKLIDLARVYATVANYGKRPEIATVLKVESDKGGVLEQNGCVKENSPATAILNSLNQPIFASESAIAQSNTQDNCLQEQVLDSRVAFLLIDILRDNKARAAEFGVNSMLVIPNHSEVAVKTGTSNDLRDNLTVGFTQKYLVAVWVGNNDNSPMSRVASGVTGAAPIFNKIMSALLATEETYQWAVPSGLVQLPICSLTGTLPCEGCPRKMEWFLEENAPTRACNPEYIHQVLNKRPEGEIFEPAAQTKHED